MNTKPMRLPGRWREGYVLDYHTSSSVYVGDDEYGHPRFDTTRTEIGELLYQLKYHSNVAVVGNIVDVVDYFVKGWKPPIEMVVPVVPSRHRALQPLLVISEAIAQRLNLPFQPNAVRRLRELPELKDVHDYNERIRLLEDAHEANSEIVRGRSVLVVDDLYRSGATLNAVTSALYDRGDVRDVYALAITRTRRG